MIIIITIVSFLSVKSCCLFNNPFDVILVSSRWREGEEIEQRIMSENCFSDNFFKHIYSLICGGHKEFKVTILNHQFIISDKSLDDTVINCFNICDKVIMPENWNKNRNSVQIWKSDLALCDTSYFIDPYMRVFVSELSSSLVHLSLMVGELLSLLSGSGGDGLLMGKLMGLIGGLKRKSLFLGHICKLFNVS